MGPGRKHRRPVFSQRGSTVSTCVNINVEFIVEIVCFGDAGRVIFF